ncbi:hypothetical protein [Catenulispora subtropica]
MASSTYAVKEREPSRHRPCRDTSIQGFPARIIEVAPPRRTECPLYRRRR